MLKIRDWDPPYPIMNRSISSRISGIIPALGWLRKSRGGPRLGISHQRRHVAIARERVERRAHATFRIYLLDPELVG
ncbi:MAG: hypothetical protein WEB53_00080 [Akkermansiaceae bacterium]